jgi:hypothetical protein
MAIEKNLIPFQDVYLNKEKANIFSDETANSVKKAIIDISTEICCKILERYEKQK